MSVVANVAVNVDARQAIQALRTIDGQAKGLKQTLANTNSVAGKLKNAFGGLSSAIAAVGLSAFIKNVAGVGVEADRTAKRIQVLAGNSQEAARVQDIATKAAKQFGLGSLTAAKGVADLYGRLQPMGVATKDIETVFIGANKAGLQMGLTADAMSNVMLQLSQALGSGVLQGDEFRSISEQMPPILNAVSQVLGVQRGELKKLGSEGKITTDVLIKAMGILSKMETVEPDAVRKFQAAMEDLQVNIGTKLLPALTPLIQGVTLLINAFNMLPGPIQSVVVGVAALGAAIGIIGPVLAGIATVFSGISTAVAVVTPIIGAFTASLGGISGVAGILAGIFSGPAGWIALLTGAGIALYAFKDQIAEVFSSIGPYAAKGFSAINNKFIDPAKQVFNSFINYVKNAFSALGDALAAPFVGFASMVKELVNGIISGVLDGINKVVLAVNQVIQLYNNVATKINLPAIPSIPQVDIPRFAEGGFVTGPTTAIVGEGGQPEYVIPASKMDDAMRRYSAGTRGEAVVTGAGAPSVSNSSANYTNQQNTYYGSGGGTSVNITTGPVLRMNNKNYVSVSDMQRGLAAAVGAAESNMMNRMNRSYATRRSMGL